MPKTAIVTDDFVAAPADEGDAIPATVPVTLPPGPAVEPTHTPAGIPRWQADPRVIAAAAKTAELRAKLDEAEIEAIRIDDRLGGAKYDPVELEATRLFDGPAADAKAKLFEAQRDSRVRCAALFRAVEIAAWAEAEAGETARQELVAAEVAGPLADLEREAARHYLALLAASAKVMRRRFAVQSAGLAIHVPPLFSGSVPGVPAYHALTVIGPELVRSGHVSAAELAAVTLD